MDLLGAGLAFAVTMLAMSIVVTASVETIHRLMGLREKGLRVMLEHFYEAEIARHVGPTSENAKETFLEEMTRNRAPAGNVMMPMAAKRAQNRDAMGPSADSAVKSESDYHFLSWIWGGRRLGSLSLEDFMGRLGGSPTGDAIATAGRDLGNEAVDTVLRDLAHKFDEFGRETSEYFSARARLLSVCVALVIAWQCYVNPYDLFAKFLTSPALAESVIKQAPELLQRADEVQRRLDATLQKTQSAGGETTDAKTAAAEQATSALKDIRSTQKEIVSSMSTLGVPIGWTDERLGAAGFARSDTFFVVYPRLDDLKRAIPTVAWLVLGGLLVGLGAPFWRDVVLSLTNLRGDAAKGAAAAAEQPTVADRRVEAATGRFLVASRARAVVAGDHTADFDVNAAVG
jgi:hypothetical protein